ncbi:MAG: sigma-70 family RNA polymerase sigma factor [Chloroflexi bacterium]|nr:sigma-70 family RNA polymerase sigma factor [Chloroflexota bacterium]
MPMIAMPNQRHGEWECTVIAERELLRRARQLEHQALADIYDQYSTGVYRYAARLLGNADLAEECVAEVFCRLLYIMNNGKGPREHLRAYIYRIAHNWITDWWRRQEALPMPMESDRPEYLMEDFTEEIPDPSEQEQLQQALLCLTPDQRQVIMLKFYEDWDNKEIAFALGKPPGAIKALQHRAVLTLRQVLHNGESNGV